MRKAIIAAIALCSCANAASAQTYLWRGYVAANGGSSNATNGTYRAYTTAGQAGVAHAQNGAGGLCAGFWCFGGSRVLDVPLPGWVPQPSDFALSLPIPNPGQNQIRFSLTLPTTSTVTLSVYDVSGRLEGDIVTRRLDAGEHDLSWRPSAPRTGVFFMHLAVDGVLRARRTIVLVQ
jgi:hypothetical protein